MGLSGGLGTNGGGVQQTAGKDQPNGYPGLDADKKLNGVIVDGGTP